MPRRRNNILKAIDVGLGLFGQIKGWFAKTPEQRAAAMLKKADRMRSKARKAERNGRVQKASQLRLAAGALEKRAKKLLDEVSTNLDDRR